MIITVPILIVIILITYFIIKQNIFYSKYVETKSIYKIEQREKTSYIPKIIWRIALNYNIEKFDKVLELDKIYAPSFETKIFTEKDVEPFIISNFGQNIYDIFCSINPIYKASQADVLRLMLLYIYGGLYMDMKIGFVKNIEWILEYKDKFLVSKDSDSFLALNYVYFPPYGEIRNAYFASNPGNIMVKRILETILGNILILRDNKEIKGNKHILCITGPLIMTRVLGDNNFVNTEVFTKRFNGCVDWLIKYKDKKHWKQIEEPLFL